MIALRTIRRRVAELESKLRPSHHAPAQDVYRTLVDGLGCAGLDEEAFTAFADRIEAGTLTDRDAATLRAMQPACSDGYEPAEYVLALRQAFRDF